MTTDPQPGERAPERPARGFGKFRLRRIAGVRMAAIGGAFCLAAGTGIGLAAHASAAPAPASRTSVPASAGGFFPSFYTKVFTSKKPYYVGRVTSQSSNSFATGYATCPHGWVATGGGYADPGHLLTAVTSAPVPGYPFATPFAWKVVMRHRWFDLAGSLSTTENGPDWFKVYVVCAPKFFPHFFMGHQSRSDAASGARAG
jgi:hypothetical protein